jgi:putative transcriptional regulator
MVYNNCKGSFTLTENSMKNRIEELRKDRGINQQELARAIRVSRQTISSIENGKYNPSLELAFIISDYFQLPIEDIFLYKGG